MSLIGVVAVDIEFALGKVVGMLTIGISAPATAISEAASHLLPEARHALENAWLDRNADPHHEL